MGEIRERVRLTNAVDEALVLRGTWRPDQVRQVTIDAIVDTGAVRSVLPQHVVDQLGLGVIGHQVAQ